MIGRPLRDGVFTAACGVATVFRGADDSIRTAISNTLRNGLKLRKRITGVLHGSVDHVVRIKRS